MKEYFTIRMDEETKKILDNIVLKDQVEFQQNKEYLLNKVDSLFDKDEELSNYSIIIDFSFSIGAAFSKVVNFAYKELIQDKNSFEKEKSLAEKQTVSNLTPKFLCNSLTMKKFEEILIFMRQYHNMTNKRKVLKCLVL